MTLSTNNGSGNGRPAQHVLPTLPYSYDALEPYISERTMRLHHDVHHRAYVEQLNRAEEALAQARHDGNWSTVNDLERQLAFNGSGHFLHTIFWSNMSPNGGGRPDNEALLQQIERDFGSFDAFRDQFTAAANALLGPGWVLLVWQPMGEKLEILQTELHHYSTQWTSVPILVLDLWEHAYYLQYQTRRPDYVESWWNVVNWPDVARRLERAQHTGSASSSADEGAPMQPPEYDDGDGSEWPDGSDWSDGPYESNGGDESEWPDGSDWDDDVGDGGTDDGPGVPAPPDDGSDEMNGRNDVDECDGTGERDGTKGPSGTNEQNGSDGRNGTNRRNGADTSPPAHPAEAGQQQQLAAIDAGEYVTYGDTGSVKTVYGSRSTIRRAVRTGAVKGGTPSRTGTLRQSLGRRHPQLR